MDTICAPSYANIMTANFEVRNIYPYITGLQWVKEIWKDTKTELMTFIKELNQKHKTIKFDFQSSIRKNAFLDTIYLIQRRKQQHPNNSISQTYKRTSICTR